MRGRQLYKTVAITGFNLGLLFLAANVAAHYWLKDAVKPRPDPGRHFLKPQDILRDNPERLASAYPGLTPEQVQDRLRVPGVVSHPVLEFMQRPMTSAAYNVGTENLRATGFVSADTSTNALNGAHWVFGGSTVFGHGVADHETLVHHLDAQSEGAPWINFGVQGYDQNLEISKLILLLKKGYRPQSVVFFDGLNDVFARLGSNFAPEESPMLPFSAYSYVYNVRALDGPGTFKRFLHSFPLVKVARRLVQPRAADSKRPATEAIYSPDSLYHQNPRLHFAQTPPSYSGKLPHLAEYGRRLIHTYRRNLDQLAHLSFAYGFKVWVLYQPNGLLRTDSIFVVDAEAYRSSPEYRVVHALQAAVRQAIANGELPGLTDASQADVGGPGGYVDLAHYSNALNKHLAARILEVRRTQPPLAKPDL